MADKESWVFGDVELDAPQDQPSKKEEDLLNAPEPKGSGAAAIDSLDVSEPDLVVPESTQNAPEQVDEALSFDFDLAEGVDLKSSEAEVGSPLDTPAIEDDFFADLKVDAVADAPLESADPAVEVTAASENDVDFGFDVDVRAEAEAKAETEAEIAIEAEAVFEQGVEAGIQEQFEPVDAPTEIAVDAFDLPDAPVAVDTVEPSTVAALDVDDFDLPNVEEMAFDVPAANLDDDFADFNFDFDDVPAVEGADVEAATAPETDGFADLSDVSSFGQALDAGFSREHVAETADEAAPEPVVTTARAGSVQFYRHVMETLLGSDDLGISAAAKDKIRTALESKKLPQLLMREMVANRSVDKMQLARAVARSQGRREIVSFIDIPSEAVRLRQELDTRVQVLLRENRIIPLLQRFYDSRMNEMHLAGENPLPDRIFESLLRELMPGFTFVWHFALREVSGAFWLANEEADVDVSMEAEALFDRIISNAIDSRASDIHIDPSIKGEPRAYVKYRIDGVVTTSKEVITLDQLGRLKVRIKNVANMPDVNENHPNKGSFSRSGYDWRVQFQPHSGRLGAQSRIVIRRLQPDVMPMEGLGYPEYFIKDIKSAASASNGVLFWTGPTGSGKTESIHSAVLSVNPMGRGLSVHTIEDPPEKRVPGYAVQMEISDADPARSGLELLKSSLRADPDVVIFGEVRDSQMAHLVFDAANTGHLVFTTLHTNTALDSITRLDELGVHGFMLSYIRGIASQRLVRRLCPHCRKKVEKVDDFTRYVFDKYEVPLDDAHLYTHDPKGCPSCNFTGYHGRIAICEWLVPTREIVEMSTMRDYSALPEAAIRAGYRPMGYMGVLHVKNGVTDIEELASKVLELSVTVQK